jgi:hypothetical protein
MDVESDAQKIGPSRRNGLLVLVGLLALVTTISCLVLVSGLVPGSGPRYTWPGANPLCGGGWEIWAAGAQLWNNHPPNPNAFVAHMPIAFSLVPLVAGLLSLAARFGTSRWRAVGGVGLILNSIILFYTLSQSVLIALTSGRSERAFDAYA